jgi:hypothetical protein
VEYQPHLPLVGDLERRRATPENDSDWRLDEPTRRAGHRGVRAARAALAAAIDTAAPAPAHAA